MRTFEATFAVRMRSHRLRVLLRVVAGLAIVLSSPEVLATSASLLDLLRRASSGLTRFQVRPSLMIVIVPRWSVRSRGTSLLRKSESVALWGCP
jgi:hypothetical protein